MFMSKHRCLKPNSLLYIVKENPNKRLPINVLVQLSSMKIFSKQCYFMYCNKLAENCNMHIMRRCFHLLENRERPLENI